MTTVQLFAPAYTAAAAAPASTPAAASRIDSPRNAGGPRGEEQPADYDLAEGRNWPLVLAWSRSAGGGPRRA
jgi:hypothetical protein